MFSTVLKAALFSSAIQLIVAASALSPRKVELDQSPDAMLAKRNWGPPAGASASGSASVSTQAMFQGWSSLTTAASKCQGVFQSGASVEVAVKAAAEFSTQVTQVNSRYSRCACNDPSAGQISGQFQASMTEFFASFQAILQTAQQQYGDAWGRQFAPVFQRCSPAFTSLKRISASLRIDLGAILQRAHVDANLFVKVGLNLHGLLGLNLGLGGLISL